MTYEIQAKVSKNQRVIIIYCPKEDELKKIVEAIKETMTKMQA